MIEEENNKLREFFRKIPHFFFVYNLFFLLPPCSILFCVCKAFIFHLMHITTCRILKVFILLLLLLWCHWSHSRILRFYIVMKNIGRILLDGKIQGNQVYGDDMLELIYTHRLFMCIWLHVIYQRSSFLK